MKIEIEIPDLEEIYCSYYEDESVTGDKLKKAIVDIAIEKFVDRMYDDYMCNSYESIRNAAKEIIKNHSSDIINRVIDNVSDEIIKKKSIVNEMPKKSEIANISKEWENYFIELIDKAIAKRFN